LIDEETISYNLICGVTPKQYLTNIGRVIPIVCLCQDMRWECCGMLCWTTLEFKIKNKK